MKEHGTVSVMIADDHPIFRKGIRDLLAEDERFAVVEEVGDGNKVFERVRDVKPDVLLLDVNMPGKNGLDIALELQSSRIAVSIIVMTMHKEGEVFDKAMDAGVRGYLLKESAEDDLLRCIDSVLGGEPYISPQISKYLLRRRTESHAVRRDTPGLERLSATEWRILKLIAEQKSSKEIADLLRISVKTVHNHRSNICEKLGLHGVNALLKFAIEKKSSL